MALFFKNRVVLLLTVILVAVVLLPLSYNLAASIRGNLMARWDIAHGHYRLLGYGLPAPWRDRYVAKLRNRYGVEFRAVAGCIVSSSLEKYVESYDAVSTDTIRHRFGHDVLERSNEEAIADWKAKNSSAIAPEPSR